MNVKACPKPINGAIGYKAYFDFLSIIKSTIDEIIIFPSPKIRVFLVPIFFNNLFTITDPTTDEMYTNKGIIATSTGSTAYSLSSGGIIIHHDVDCLLLNAICPHSLSFRPIAFPRDITIKVFVSSESMYSALVVADGIQKITRKPKQGIEVSLSDKFINIVVLPKFISFPIKVWQRKLVDQLKWNSSFKNLK